MNMNLPPNVKGRKTGRNVDFLRPNSGSKLGFLTDPQREQLCRWLLKPGMPYPKIIELIKQEFGITTTTAALSLYYKKYIAVHLIAQRQQTVDVICKVDDDIQRNPLALVPATLDALKRTAWRLANDETTDPKTLKIFYELVLRSEEQQIRRETNAVKSRRMDLMEHKAKQAERAAADTKLTDSQFAERMRNIFKRNAAISNRSQNGAVTADEKQEDRVHTNGIAS